MPQALVMTQAPSGVGGLGRGVSAATGSAREGTRTGIPHGTAIRGWGGSSGSFSSNRWGKHSFLCTCDEKGDAEPTRDMVVAQGATPDDNIVPLPTWYPRETAVALRIGTCLSVKQPHFHTGKFGHIAAGDMFRRSPPVLLIFRTGKAPT
jgi:hypothetical protein